MVIITSSLIHNSKSLLQAFNQLCISHSLFPPHQYITTDDLPDVAPVLRVLLEFMQEQLQAVRLEGLGVQDQAWF